MSDERPLCECHGEPMYVYGGERRCRVKFLAYQRRAYAKNPEPRREKRRRYYAANREREREQQRRYREEHQEEIRETQRLYRVNHSEKIAKAQALYNQNLSGPELAKTRLKERRRKALKRMAERKARLAEDRLEAASG